MLCARVLRYKNEIIIKFSLYSKQLIKNVSKFNNTLHDDRLAIVKDINQNVNNFIEITKEINLKRRFFSALHLIESLNTVGNFFSFKSKLHVNRTLKPILSKKLLSQFSSHLYYFRCDIINHLLNLYHDNLVTIDEKYYMLCSFSKSWDLVPIRTWNSLFESLINELHLHSPIQIANILLIHHRIHHLSHKQVNYNVIRSDNNITRIKCPNETNFTGIGDYNLITNDHIHSLGLTLLSKDVGLLKPKKIIELVYLETRRNCKFINFYNAAHIHLMGLNNLTFGNYTTLIRLNTQVLQMCISVFGGENQLLQELNDIICIFSNIMECVEFYNNMVVSKKNIKMLPDNKMIYHDLERTIDVNKTFRPKYHSILILDALCSKPILKSLSLLDEHHIHLNINITQLLKKYHSSINKLIDITLNNINSIQCSSIFSTLRISGSMYSKFFLGREFSCSNKEIGNVVSANIESQVSLITHSRLNANIKRLNL